MPTVEVLAYSPLNMKEFIDFCIKGIKDGDVFVEDEDGREIRGVMSWLHGRAVTKAQFFHTPIDDKKLSFFMALVEKHPTEVDDRPWFRREMATPPQILLEPEIAGIDRQLRLDGQIGIIDGFPSLADLLAALKHQPNLDDEFNLQRERVLETLKQLKEDPAGRRKFLAALRSDINSKPTEVFARLNFSLVD